MSDGIIDFGDYARRKEEESRPERTMFALWGGEGERARLALPLWRAVGLLGGSRAMLGSEPADGAGGTLEALVVLDLAADPARTSMPASAVQGLWGEPEAPALSRSEGVVAVFLGEEGGRRFHLVVDGVPDPGDDGERLPVDDLYFLAGECAGLLFHRYLAYE